MTDYVYARPVDPFGGNTVDVPQGPLVDSWQTVYEELATFRQCHPYLWIKTRHGTIGAHIAPPKAFALTGKYMSPFAAVWTKH